MSPVVQRQTRNQAGLAPPTSTPVTVSPSEVVGFTVHHSDGPATQTSAEIQDFHQNTRGWNDTGYARTIEDHGDHAVIVDARGYGTELAHALGFNRSHIGVCVIGNYNNHLPSSHALAAVVICRAEAEEWAGRSLPVGGHRDLMATGCPGDALHSWVHSGMPVDDATGGNPLLGLSEGDGIPTPSEGVKAVQRMITNAGFGDLLGDYGVDGQWGPATSAGLLAARQYVGSNLTSIKTMTGESYAQLVTAVSRHQAERAVTNIDSNGGGPLPGSENVTITGTLRRD